MRSCAADLAADREPVLAGQHEVEHHEVGAQALEALGHGRAVALDEDLEVVVLEVVADGGREPRVVLDQQHAAAATPRSGAGGTGREPRLASDASFGGETEEYSTPHTLPGGDVSCPTLQVCYSPARFATTVPVDEHREHRARIGLAPLVVVEVVGMLPDVECQQRRRRRWSVASPRWACSRSRGAGRAGSATPSRCRIARRAILAIWSHIVSNEPKSRSIQVVQRARHLAAAPAP